MNLKNINEINKIDFISSFENIFEESKFKYLVKIIQKGVILII